MRNQTKESLLFKGLVEPIYYNSDGKSIGFGMSLSCGETIVLNADHKIKRLRKSAGKKISVIGDYCNIRKIFTVKRIMSYMSDLDRTLL